jgi:hypothetical protein
VPASRSFGAAPADACLNTEAGCRLPNSGAGARSAVARQPTAPRVTRVTSQYTSGESSKS